MDIPRPEHPRPQFYREDWLSLNGVWQFEIDFGRSGKARKLPAAPQLSDEIILPFCPESSLSGIRYVDFMPAVWYKRAVVIPPEKRGKRALLHIGAADYYTELYVNGALAATHEGGYVSFTADITAFLREGENVLTIYCEDDTRSGCQPRGKQSAEFFSHGCDYTRTTGIWQSVWLEFVAQTYIKSVHITPDAANGRAQVRCDLAGDIRGVTLRARAIYQGRPMGEDAVLPGGDSAVLSLALSEKHLWNVGEPELYDLTLTLSRGKDALDTLESYFGLRDIRFDGRRLLINERPVFMRLVLDQGFYPDGIYTAPSDAELKKDIERSLAMGFNGARLHQKVFEARFLYHADHLGYLCWGEMGSWGLNHSDPAALAAFLKEWLQAVDRDYSAPCVIGWCPFNETWDYQGRKQDDEVLRTVYRATKALDHTRPVIDTSGNFHTETDIYDVHDYEQNPAVFASCYGPGAPLLHERFPKRQQYAGQGPLFVSEYGGIWWSDTDKAGWGYGERVASREAFIERFRGLTDALLDNPAHCGLCYTQLTDVEQEQNGLYTYDRKAKFDPAVIRPIMARKAAMEKEE